MDSQSNSAGIIFEQAGGWSAGSEVPGPRPEAPREGCEWEPARLVAICASGGGVPKLPLAAARIVEDGIEGDGHAHEKHQRPDRAMSILDIEVLRELTEEGFPLLPGAIGENLTVQGLRVQALAPGTLLQIGEVVLRLESPRKPCYVLDAIDPRLKEVIVGRCGYLASVVRGGTIAPDMPVRRLGGPADMNRLAVPRRSYP